MDGLTKKSIRYSGITAREVAGGVAVLSLVVSV